MNSSDAIAALRHHSPELIAIGASAGAIDALGQILPALPSTFTPPIVIVVHIPADRPSGLASVFRERCQLPVDEVEDKCPLRPGIFFAPPDYHVLVERTGTLALANDDAVYFSRPSIDVLFESVAAAYQKRGMGILLSGASADGAAGLHRIHLCGGVTWVQTPASAGAATMPEAALALMPHPELTPVEIGQALATWGRS